MRSLRCLLLALAVSAAACGGSQSAAPAIPLTPELTAAHVAVARAGCVRCHADDDVEHDPVLGPRLDDAVRWRAADAGASFLRDHHGGDDAPALAAWLQALGADAEVAAPAATSPRAAVRGARLVRELACGACHAPAAFDELPARVDHGRLADFLAEPAVRHPELVHVPLQPDEAADIAAHLLRSQRVDGEAHPGFGWTTWQQRITEPGLPDVAKAKVAATGVATVIDSKVGPRKNHFVARFDATLDVPAAGTWTFVTGSDDSSWLWIDDDLVVRNEDLAPHRRREGKVTLAAGPHDLAVVYTQAGGGASLEVLWRGPGVDEQPIPAARATTRTCTLQPPSPPVPPAIADVALGRAAARARRCDACHGFDDAAFAELPAPAPARNFRELRDAPCPRDAAGQALRGAAVAAASRPADAASHLAAAMLRDGCTSCHVRDGRGGLQPPVRATLAEVEDLGDEGRLPPDLSHVGRRLRPAWIEKVLREGHAVRPYLRVRMPKFGEAKAKQYAAWFAEVDGNDARPEPEFSVSAVQRGRELAGQGGRNCITCHSFQGNPSLGPQGMDLGIQHERLQPGWFRDWLLQPAVLRPGTRMPSLWWRDDEASRGEVDALRCWLSLGASAPLPLGVKGRDGSLVLVAGERPRLHGAFLDGVSARCLAVGTAERTHFAFDLSKSSLVWLWRGDFLDASGTWSGRAGKLLKPLGGDWRVLADVTLQGGAPRRLLGQRITADGYPVLQVEVGDAEYEDEVRPRLATGGSEVVRTLRCRRGELDVEFPPADPGLRITAGEVAASRHHVGTGQVLEVVYRW